MKRKLVLQIVFSFLLPAYGLAQSQNSGTSAIDFLKIGVGAKAAGLGEAFVAVADDATSSFWNAAGLTNLNQSQATFMHNEWLSDLRYEYLSYAAPYQERGTFGISMSYLSLGKFDGYDLTGNPTGDFSAYDWSVLLAYGQKLTPQFSLGGGVKYIEEKMADDKAGAFAFDLGALYSFDYINLGMSVRNLGSQVKFIKEEYSLPLTFDFGASYQGLGNNILLAFDVEVPRDNSVRLKQGIEYNFQQSFFLRMGYDYKTSGSEFGGASGLALGAGFLLHNYRFDYTYTPNVNLGDAHRLSFTVDFGAPRGL